MEHRASQYRPQPDQKQPSPGVGEGSAGVPTQQPEQTELTRVEKACQRIKEYYKNTEEGSVQFMALSELVDWEEAAIWYSRESIEIRKERLDLTEGTIRQHKKDPAYEEEFCAAQKLYGGLLYMLYNTVGNRHEQNKVAVEDRERRASAGILPEEVELLQHIIEKVKTRKNRQSQTSRQE